LGRITIFAKGNLDVRDSLHSLHDGGKLLWNGINEIVRARFPGTVVRLRHETCTGSEALAAANGTVPAEVAARSLPLAPYSAASQFSSALFTTEADAIVLSIQPDLAVPLVRHRRDGYLLHPCRWECWTEADHLWLRSAFLPESPPQPAVAMRNLAAVIARLQQRSAAPILIYNLSAIVPGEWIHCHQGVGEILSTRIRRFNLALTELSEQTGISIVDVDAIVARAGADRLKLDYWHLTADGCRLVAEEVVRILEDRGCLPAPESAR
jgi:hypothetical protein